MPFMSFVNFSQFNLDFHEFRNCLRLVWRFLKKICKIFGESLANSRVAVFCGNGKNAGDGFVIADLLNSINVNADIIICVRGASDFDNTPETPVVKQPKPTTVPEESYDDDVEKLPF